MEKILRGVHEFQTQDFPPQREYYEKLAAKQQKPIALFITCSDSRVIPHQITRTEPGDLFQLRTAGNIIPPYGAVVSGESATVEYSIAVLGVKNIIVCGHSQCGAIKALIEAENLDELPAVKSWFAHAESTRRIVRQKYEHLSSAERAVAATEENVLVQMNNLSTHPYVAARLATGDLNIYGWYYDIATGQILQYDQPEGEFLPFDGEVRAAAPLPLRGRMTGNGLRLAKAMNGSGE
ncbi:MAG: carbonic anhydrase [Planctomycetia bacterium]|nr:carbonic anhydrase [Planctomycetia bacterium]